MGSEKRNDGTAGKLGTFAGVFTPSILTILGIILFLRLGYVVGQSGLMRALLIVALANGISVLTTFSLSAVATNLRIKAGGDYYLISRTLGLGFGGAIGLVLFLAQAVSIGFYCVGFAEAVATMLQIQNSWAIHGIAAAAVVSLFVLAWLGADWATRFQYVVMALIAAALLSFAIGGLERWDTGLLERNWLPPADALPFWVGFAIFFPAVTGFTQGVSMSGDLAAPGRSIPLGTFGAVGLSIVVYVGCTILFAAALPNGVLATDLDAMRKIAAFGPLIGAGVIAATLSSALASFLGAPRILQSLAGDRIFPALHVFARGTGAGNNPRRAILLSGAIALGVVALGNLNLIASVVSMFFLISYGLVNYATFYEAQAKSPSFRPSFRWYDRRLSLLGGLGCLGAMLAIDIAAGIVAVAVVFAIFQYLRFRAVPARWADSRRSHHLNQVRTHLLAAQAETEHPRTWRPQLLVFSEDEGRRAQLLRFAGWIEAGGGLTTVVRVLEGQGQAMLPRREEAAEALTKELKELGSGAFPLVVAAPALDAAVATIVQAAGVGPVRANTVLVNWLRESRNFAKSLGRGRFGQNLRTAFRLGCNLLVLDAADDDWAKLQDVPSAERVVDVWWTESPTGHLMLLLAYLLTRSADWEDATIRVLSQTGADQSEEARVAEIAEMLEDVRIDAKPVVVAEAVSETVVAQSSESHLVFLPFSIHGGRFYQPFGGEVQDILAPLPVVIMTMAAQDVDLDAEPEEGAAAELAEATDRLKDASDRLEQREKEAAQAAESLAAAKQEAKDGSPDAKSKVAAVKAEVDKAKRRLRRADATRQTALDRVTELGGEAPKASDDES